MLTYFFSLYPQGGGEEATSMRMIAYSSELADIHVDLLGPAFRRLVRDPARKFMPAVAEIRREAAIVWRNVRAGRPAIGLPSQEPATDIDTERFLGELAPKPGEPTPPALAAGGIARIGAGG